MQEGDAPLHCALSRGDRPTVQLLLKKGANKEAKDKVQNTLAKNGILFIVHLFEAMMLLLILTPLHGISLYL